MWKAPELAHTITSLLTRALMSPAPLSSESCAATKQPPCLQCSSLTAIPWPSGNPYRRQNEETVMAFNTNNYVLWNLTPKKRYNCEVSAFFSCRLLGSELTARLPGLVLRPWWVFPTVLSKDVVAEPTSRGLGTLRRSPVWTPTATTDTRTIWIVNGL